MTALPRLLVSAAHKSSGKTTLAIGLAAALARRGLVVQPFKKGPDYIDPMWLSIAAGRPCRNLDPWLCDETALRDSIARHAAGAHLALVEGNKGLHDGLSLDGRDSNAALATMLGLPVVLALDARGMTRGVAPLILGFQAFDRAVRIAGVVLNRVGGSRHESKLRAAIERYTDVPVLGALAEDRSLAIDERHIGLVPGNEATDAEAVVARIGAATAAAVDLDAIVAAARSAPDLAASPGVPAAAATARGSAESACRVGIARDRAFGFYYADDLDALEAAGATLVPIDTLRDRALPDIDALFVGGGFPEMHAAELAANEPLKAAIARAIAAGLPTYAECGGLMYLARSLTFRGRTHSMVGAIPGDAVMHERPVGRGYVEIEETDAMPWPKSGSATIRGHEFHHSSLENLPADARFAYAVRRGHGIDGRRDGYVRGNLLASYAHLRGTGGTDWPARFVAFARAARGAGASPETPRDTPASRPHDCVPCP
jgi:cobyrinic acid a,c-diamide synthase